MTSDEQLSLVFQYEEAKTSEFTCLLKLLSSAEDDSMRHLSFNMLKRAVVRPEVTDAEALDIFFFAVEIGVLIKKYEYCDTDCADEAYEVTEQNLIEAAKDGYLTLERVGLIDREYKSKVSLSFKGNTSKAREIWKFYEGML